MNSDEHNHQHHDRDTSVATEHHPETENPAEAEKYHPDTHVHLSVRSVIRLAVVLGIIFAIIFVIGYLPRVRDKRITNRQAQAERTNAPMVDVVPARISNSRVDLELPGTTTALVEAPIYARASGYLGKRFVDIGDRVRSQQLLATIEAPDLDQQVDQARATLDQSIATLNQLEAQLRLQSVTWDRYKVLVARGVLSRQDGDTQEANYNVALANVNAGHHTVNANRAALDRLLQLQGYERVVAPFNGIITARNVDVGSLISASGSGMGFTGSSSTGAALPSTGISQGGEMFRVAQLDRLRVFVSVPESYAQFIHVGESVNCQFDALGGQSYEGKVTRTANAMDPATRTLLTEVQVANRNGKILPGMFTRVTFTNVRARPPIIVPSDSIIARANGITVAVVKDNVVHISRVQIGRDYGSQTEIVQGLGPGDLVVINPTDAASDGAHVQARVLKQGPPGGATQQGGSQSGVPPSPGRRSGNQTPANE